MEWHYFKSGDDFRTIADYYRSEMKKHGWRELRWMNIEMTVPEWTSEGGRYKIAGSDSPNAASVDITDKGQGVVYFVLLLARY